MVVRPSAVTPDVPKDFSWYAKVEEVEVLAKSAESGEPAFTSTL
jgi:hypothetical protein